MKFASKKYTKPQSLENVFDQFYSRLYRFFRLRGAGVEEAKDLASFLLAFQPNQPPGSLQNLTGLYTIGDGITPAQWSDS